MVRKVIAILRAGVMGKREKIVKYSDHFIENSPDKSRFSIAITRAGDPSRPTSFRGSAIMVSRGLEILLRF